MGQSKMEKRLGVGQMEITSTLRSIYGSDYLHIVVWVFEKLLRYFSYQDIS